MRNILRVLTTLLAIALSSVWAFQQGQKETEKETFLYQQCPCKAKLGDQAEISLGKEFRFVDSANVPKFFEVTQNIPDGNELGVVIHEKGDWFVIFRFDDVGYVKDDEKSSLDAEALLKSIKEGTEGANEERKKRGWGTLSVVGWQQKPFYNEESHNLEWGIIGQDETGGRTVNYKSRILGRKGVMSVNLVTDVETVAADLQSYRKMATGFTYLATNRYSEFVKGDKVAEYGLSALVLGGAAAAAVKTGLFKTLLKFAAALWKLILVGILGLGGAIWRLLRGLKKSPEEPSGESV
jgi:uncharacterized membrane-anchored protein